MTLFLTLSWKLGTLRYHQNPKLGLYWLLGESTGNIVWRQCSRSGAYLSPRKKRWCFCRLFLAILAPKSSVKVLELSETISLKCTWYFKKKIESTKNSPKFNFWGFMWFHVTISHMFIHTHLVMIFGNPYLSLQESPAISPFNRTKNITGPPSVGHGYQCQQFLASTPRPQDAWETTTTSDYFGFSRGNFDKPTFICHI